MYYVHTYYQTGIIVFQSEFLDDIDEWFEENDPSRHTHTVSFESLED